jgi:hypothetical protein
MIGMTQLNVKQISYTTYRGNLKLEFTVLCPFLNGYRDRRVT